MLKDLNFSESSLLFKLSLFGLLIYKIFTYELWIVSDRLFPIVAFSDHFQITNNYLHNILSCLSLIAIAILLFRVQIAVLVLLIVLEFALLATDVMRWQPTVYQFFLTLIIYLIAPKRFKTYLLLLLSATYLYSGILKFNLAFINLNWSKSILTEFIGIPAEYANHKIIKALGFIIPLVETLAGILLLTRHRLKGFYLIIFTHIFILLFIGKMSFTYSFAIWFWNVIMLSYAIIYVLKPKIKSIKFGVISSVWVILIFAMPSLNFFGKYYPYFSFDMFTGDRHYLYINTSLSEDHKLKTYFTDDVEDYISQKVTILAYQELGVPLTHSRWLYARFIKAFDSKYPKLETCYEIRYYPFHTYELFEVK